MQAEGGPAQRWVCWLPRTSCITGVFWDRHSVGQVRSVELEELKLTCAEERLGATLDRELAIDIVDMALDRTERDD